MFDSALLGGPVPYSTILYLAGAPAGTGLNAPVRVESHTAFSSVIVACRGRRFELILTQEDLVYEICLVPGGGHQPVAAPYIPYCADRHLAERSGSELVGMASAWGYERHQEYDHSPASGHPGHEGGRLIAAAVGHVHQGRQDPGGGLLRGPRPIDEVHGFGEMAVAVRHAMDREFLRLEKVARSAAAHIRKRAGGSCVSCSGAPFLSPLADEPARFCSRECAADSSQGSNAATPPKE